MRSTDSQAASENSGLMLWRPGDRVDDRVTELRVLGQWHPGHGKAERRQKAEPGPTHTFNAQTKGFHECDYEQGRLGERGQSESETKDTSEHW